jgi:hypothetical protein
VVVIDRPEADDGRGLERLIAIETCLSPPYLQGFVLIEYVKTCRDFLFANGTNRFYQRVSLTEDIYRSEENPGSVI